MKQCAREDVIGTHEMGARGMVGSGWHALATLSVAVMEVGIYDIMQSAVMTRAAHLIILAHSALRV